MVSRSSLDILKGADIEQNAVRRCANVIRTHLILIYPCMYISIYPRHSRWTLGLLNEWRVQPDRNDLSPWEINKWTNKYGSTTNTVENQRRSRNKNDRFEKYDRLFTRVSGACIIYRRLQQNFSTSSQIHVVFIKFSHVPPRILFLLLPSLLSHFFFLFYIV